MRKRGFTLLELLIVVAILALVSSTLLLRGGAADAERKLDLAAAEVAGALRFARQEARRTGQPHGARVTPADGRVRVYRLDTAPSPPAELYTVVHPVEKRTYDLTVPALPFAANVAVSSSSFSFASGASTQSLSFEPHGAPVSPLNRSLMTTGQVVLQHQGAARTVTVAAGTGRVTVQ